MIFDAIVGVLSAVLEGVFALLPTMSLPAGLVESSGGVGAVAAGLNGIVPVQTLGGCLVAVLAVRLFIALWAVVVWIYDRFPFKAT